MGAPQLIVPPANRGFDDGNRPARNFPRARPRSASASGKIHLAPNDRALCATVRCSAENEFCEARFRLPHPLRTQAEGHRPMRLGPVRVTEKLMPAGPAATNPPSPDKLG